MALMLTLARVHAADPVFSGPQPGETITPFKVFEIAGPAADHERDPVAEAGNAPLALVFVHAIERSLVPLLRAIDLYGADHQIQLRTEVIFLSADRLEGERRVRAAANSLRLRSRVGLSIDGAEGPGNYGLNKECMMTVVAAKENRVLSNFALVQPGIADAPAVLTALAATSGNPPPPDLARYTQPPAGSMRGRPMAEAGAQDGFPGAVPTDPQLNRLIRQFIRPTNDVATVDRLLSTIETHAAGSADLTRQAAEAWTRILHFGDRYGTPYARDAAKASMDRLKTRAPR
jgi:hypothetical protein